MVISVTAGMLVIISVLFYNHVGEKKERMMTEPDEIRRNKINELTENEKQEEEL